MGNARTGRDIDAALRKKGFRRDLDGKHIWYYFQDEHGEDSCVIAPSEAWRKETR